MKGDLIGKDVLMMEALYHDDTAVSGDDTDSSVDEHTICLISTAHKITTLGSTMVLDYPLYDMTGRSETWASL